MKNKKDRKNVTTKVNTNISQLDLKTKNNLTKLVGSWFAVQNKEGRMNY